MNRIITSAALLAAVGTLMGCSKEETVSSENIKTAGIAAEIEVKAESETNVTVRAELRVGGPDGTLVILDNGDKLSVTAAGETKGMSAVSEGVYEAKLGTGQEDTEFVISLERPDDTAAPNSAGKLPPPFALTAPANGLSRGTEDLTVTWDPSGTDSITINLDGDCIVDEEIKVSDTGSHTIKAGTLSSTGPKDDPKTCDIRAQVWRNRGGSPDSAYDSDSKMVLRQVRSATFQSAP